MMGMLITLDNRSYRMTKRQFTIGSESTCDLVLVGTNIAPHHAEILMDGDSNFAIRPYPPSQITLNGQIVGHEVNLHPGDVLTINDVELRFELGQEQHFWQTGFSPGDVIEGECHDITAAIPSTALSVIPTALLTQHYEPRLGCAYCFRTLDPEDADETLRLAVKHNDQLYHRKCWEQSPQRNLPVTEYVPPKPPPLRVVSLLPSPSYMGPLNTLESVPMGISESVVVFHLVQQAVVYVRNNSDELLLLDRRNMPMWAYIDYGNHDLQNEMAPLPPRQARQLTIYPHRIRPGLDTHYLNLTPTQGVNLEAQGTNDWLVLMVVGIYALFFWHMSSLFQLHNWVSGDVIRLGYVIEPLLTLTLLFGSLALLAPVHLLWSVFNLLRKTEESRLRALLAPITEPLEAFVVMQLRSVYLPDIMSRFVMPVSLVLIGFGFAGALAFFLPTFILVSLTGRFFGALFVVAECSAILYVLYLFGKGYGFNLVTFTQQLVRAGQTLYRHLVQQ